MTERPKSFEEMLGFTKKEMQAWRIVGKGNVMHNNQQTPLREKRLHAVANSPHYRSAVEKYHEASKQEYGHLWD